MPVVSVPLGLSSTVCTLPTGATTRLQLNPAAAARLPPVCAVALLAPPGPQVAQRVAHQRHPPHDRTGEQLENQRVY